QHPRLLDPPAPGVVGAAWPAPVRVGPPSCPAGGARLFVSDRRRRRQHAARAARTLGGAGDLHPPPDRGRPDTDTTAAAQDGPAGQDFTRGPVRAARPVAGRHPRDGARPRRSRAREGGPGAGHHAGRPGGAAARPVRGPAGGGRGADPRRPRDGGDPAQRGDEGARAVSTPAPVDRRHAPTRPGTFSDTARALATVRVMADQAFSRAAGAPLVHGNAVRILKDGAENYPAWLEAIAAARESVHFECYIVHDDEVGQRFADALAARAREGIRIRVIYDWLGALGHTGGRFWRRLREAGIEVRCFNPPRLDEPLGWLARDHRKSITIDGRLAFVTGLCIGRMWEGYPEKNLAPWRDTGVEIRGPAVADVGRAFAEAWAACGEPL